MDEMTFAGGALDRAAHRRTDTEYERALGAPEARTIVVGEGPSVALDGDSRLARVTLETAAADAIFLGDDGGAPLFAAAAAGLGEELTHLRQAIGLLTPDEAALAGYAAALIGWQERSRHCGRCGTRTHAAQGGHSRRCPQCGLVVYPRTDPVVTMVVEAGDRCLLTRRHGAPDGMWSALAGFVEPGETPEEAVVRETREEVGIDVVAAGYLGAQPWPFPGALMLGFRALADPGETRAEVCEPDELQAVRWFERAELRAALDDLSVRIPPPVAIGHHLIVGFLERGPSSGE
jgi:NAD+ diphosphatase